MASFFEIGDFTEIKSLEDMINRPNYRPEIDPKTVKIEDIVAPYALKNIRCGLKDCHQPHDAGLLVRTNSGIEVNIGHVCGTKHFGADFKTLRNRHLKEDRIRIYKRKLNEVLDQQEQIFSRILEMRNAEHGARWLRRSLDHFKTAYPNPIIAELEARAKRDADLVQVSRERTKEEIDVAHAANPTASRDSFRYETVTVGRLRGLYIFERDIRVVLVKQLEARLRELIALDKERASYTQLQDFYTWASSIEDLFADAELIVSEGRVFFLPDNLQLLGYLTLSESTREEFSNLAWDYDAGIAINTKQKRKK